MSLPKRMALSLLLPGVMFLGCQEPPPPLETLLPVEAVVAEYNANAARIPRLWARAQITYKENALALPMSADGLLVLQKGADRSAPADFFLKFKEAGEELGRLGVSTQDEAYYLWFRAGRQRRCLWGRLATAGAENIEELPIDPTQLLSVLSICELPTGQTSVPFVAQRIQFDPCAYVLTYVDRQPITGRFQFRREVFLRWSRTEPRRPFRVRLLDERGLAVLSTEMKDYQPVATDDATEPRMPTDIRLRWRETGGELHLKLSQMTTADRVDPEAYRFWRWLPDELRGRARQVDAKCPSPAPPMRKGANGP